MKALILIPLLLGGCSILFSGCSTHAESPQDHNDIELTIKTDHDTYLRSEQVKITMRVRNIGKDIVTLEFPTSRQYDFIIKGEDEEVWKWSRDKYFTQAFIIITINPGDSITYNSEWDQIDNIGNNVAPGRYWIVGIVPAIGRELSVSRPITIKSN